MKKSVIIAGIVLFTISAVSAYAQNPANGYYKDVFMDSGMRLASKKDIPVTRCLGLTMDVYRGSHSKRLYSADTVTQNAAFIGSELDANGVLLYPDGAPRFRMIYVNGGTAAPHGRSLLEEGRRHIYEFVKAGGSYLGSCAGAYLACTGTHKKDSLGRDYNKYYSEYLGVYPGVCTNANLENTRLRIDVPENSPILKYGYDFGEDNHIDSIYHNGGCFMDYNDLVPGGEILFNYNYPPKPMHGNGAVWCYKENEYTGRAMACGPHPESKSYGGGLDMMCAMVRYCLEGNGAPRIKGELLNGQPRKMVKETKDNDPAYTRIGDKQYHHFTVDVPEGVEKLVVKLTPVKGYEDFDLFLYGAYDDFAFAGNARYKSVHFGVEKTLEVTAPKAGKLYVSVFCDTTVDTQDTFFGTQYSGRLEVLNGIPYIIDVKY